MNDDVGVLLEDFPGIGRNLDSPGSVTRSDNFAEVAADFCRVAIDGTTDFDGLLFAHEARGGSADRTDAELDGANLLFHDDLRWLQWRSRTLRIFATSESHTIREFAEAGKHGNRI